MVIAIRVSLAKTRSRSVFLSNNVNLDVANTNCRDTFLSKVAARLKPLLRQKSTTDPSRLLRRVTVLVTAWRAALLCTAELAPKRLFRCFVQNAIQFCLVVPTLAIIMSRYHSGRRYFGRATGGGDKRSQRVCSLRRRAFTVDFCVGLGASNFLIFCYLFFFFFFFFFFWVFYII